MNLQCEIHEKKIQVICLNKFCKQNRFLCDDCLSDKNVHNCAFLDLRGDFMGYLKENHKQSTIACRKFSVKLNNIMNRVVMNFREIEKQLNDNFFMSIEEVCKMKTQDLSDYINHIDKFQSLYEGQIERIDKIFMDANQKTKECFLDLELSNLIYKKSCSNNYFNLGLQQYQQQNWEQAIELFDQSLDKYSDNVESICQKGYCLAQLNRIQQSIDTFNAALTLNNNHINSICGMGITYQKFLIQQQGTEDGSIKWFDKALGIDKNNITALFYKGQSLRILKKYIEAINYFDQVLSCNQNYIDAITAKGQTLRLMNEFEQSIQWYDKALKLNPNHFQSLLLKGQSLYQLGRIKESEEYLSKAMNVQN